MPNRQKNLISYDFLKCLKEEHDKVFILDEENHDTYHQWYSWFVGTGKFDEVFSKVSKMFNIYDALYVYSKRLANEQYCEFLESLMFMMVEFDIIKEGEKQKEDLLDGKKLVRKTFNGYNVLSYEVIQKVHKKMWTFLIIKR